MAIIEVRKERNMDREGHCLYHVYKGGHFFVTCETKKQLNIVLKTMGVK